jgi:drug/metabolite transporter (DMT)-like permease
MAARVHGARRDLGLDLTIVAVLFDALFGVLGSGLAYLLNYDVLARAGATVASAVTYVWTVLGIIVLGERLSWNEPLGGAVLLAGVALMSGATRAIADVGSDARDQGTHDPAAGGNGRVAVPRVLFRTFA